VLLIFIAAATAQKLAAVAGSLYSALRSAAQRK